MPAVEESLADKVVLVTGGARRIGAAIAGALHAQGMRVAVHYRHSEEDARALCAGFNAQRADSGAMFAADLLDTATIPTLVEDVVTALGRLDVLVNNASTFYPTPLGTIDDAAWADLLGTNLKAPLFLCQAAAPHLAAHAGAIVNLVDIHGQRPLRGHPVYCAAKAGLIMLTQALALELGPEVRVNAVAPGAILWPERTLQERSEHPARQRQGSPEAVANAVLHLVRAGSTNGEIITVGGPAA